jgi:hypothetical protein
MVHFKVGQMWSMRIAPALEVTALNMGGGHVMNTRNITLSVRSISRQTKSRLEILSDYTRLTYGSIIDDAVDALWHDYLADGHPVCEKADVRAD